MRQHVLRYWLFYYFGIFLFATSMFTLAVKKARAEMYLQTTPILGEVQYNGTDFCIEQKDTLGMLSAHIGGRSDVAWKRKVAQGKCGVWHGEYMYSRILPMRGTIIGHEKWVVEVKLRMKEWAPAYTFVGFKPFGAQMVVWKPEYAQASPDYWKWFGLAKTTKESRARLATLGHQWESCCSKADRVKTQFRVNKMSGGDEWWYLNPITNEWKLVPNDIIHYEDDPTMPAQLKVEGVLFIYNGIEVCFWPPEEGG